MTLTHYLKTTVCLGLAVLPAAGMAQDAFDLGEIVVSGALTPQEAARTGATVDVLDAGTLAAAPTSLAQTLDRVPGVTFSSNGGLGTSASVRVRGLDGRYLGVRLDGIDIADPSGTQVQFDFGGLTAAGLGRVEIVKGSQSALYGSEAIGGLINISTRAPDTLGFTGNVTVEGGSFKTYSAGVGLAHRSDRAGLSFNLSRVTSDGISARAGDAEEDGFEQTLVTLSGDFAVTETVTLGFSAFYRDAEVEIDRSATDNSGVNFTEQTGARVFAKVDAFGIDHEFAYASFVSERRDPGGFTSAFDGDRQVLSYLGTTELNGGATLSFGLERTEESFETSTDSGETATNSALAELLFRPADAVDVAVSLRYDDDDDFGGQLSGRVALAWNVTPDTTVRAVAGTGFRAPSLFERFSAFGDPALEVEKSRSLEFGVERRFGPDSFLKATAFYTEIDDLIDFDGAATACGSGFGCYGQVPGTTVSQGIEIAGRYALNDRFALFGDYTFTDAKTDGSRLARVPAHDLRIGVDAMLTDRLSGRVDVQYVGDVEASAFAPAGNKVGDYTLTNLALSYKVTDNATAYFRAENLFDEDYETAGGFNTPGQAFFAGLRASF